MSLRISRLYTSKFKYFHIVSFGGRSTAPSSSFSTASTSPPSNASSTDTSPTVTIPFSRISIYDSPPPQLVLSAARLFFVQSIAAGAFSSVSIYKYWLQQKTLATTATGNIATKTSLVSPVSSNSTGSALADSIIQNAHQSTTLSLPSPSSSLLTYLQIIEPHQLHTVLGITFGIYALFSHLVAYGITDRTVIKMELESNTINPNSLSIDPQNQQQSSSTSTSSSVSSLNHANLVGQSEYDRIYITRPTLFGGTTQSVHDRKDIRGAPANAIITTFRLRKNNKNGREINQYLFPVQPGWKSDNIKYLRTLIYGEYFRKEEVNPVEDKKLIAIEGFGSYRPAQFADPHHINAQQQLEQTILNKALPSSTTTTSSSSSGETNLVSNTIPKNDIIINQSNTNSIKIDQGTVWTKFNVPPPLTLEQKRKIERDQKLLNKESSEIKLPKIGIPTNIGLDGKPLDTETNGTEVEEKNSKKLE